MQYTGLNELRQKFLDYFEKQGHLKMPSFPLIPRGDNSLLLINSGMAPLKPYFSGEAVPPRRRVTTCQKCIRTPDIESVGKTSRHGTFFEMLGNFSFGDYFKREAIAFAWEFVTKELEIPESLLYVSVYLEDDEAHDIWKNEMGVDESHIVRLGKADNFWEIGAGPCGPCSEIYFDRGEKYGCGKPDCAVGCDCDRYVEFWNLVFTQFYNDGNDNYTPLKQKNIDTGMGLERLACIMQGVGSLFEVDTIKNILDYTAKLVGSSYRENDKTDVSLRIITDHIRSTTMMICDGVMPSNEGRGYVLRRLLRRAARHGKLLGIEDAFLCKICDVVIDESKSAYPELEDKRDFIKKVIQIEEESFSRTVDSGMTMLNRIIEKHRETGSLVFSGDDAFKLNDTYGFPVDLTTEILEEHGLTLDRARFDELMGQQKERARKAQAALGDFGWESVELDLDKNIKTEFVGYDTLECEANILAIISGNEVVSVAIKGDSVSVLLDRTAMYAESGGQLADTGSIETTDGIIEISDVKKLKDGKILHFGSVISGSVACDSKAAVKVDEKRRSAVRRAHSSTHLLHKALRNVLGTHVEQAGSLVGPDSFRFDFTHFAALTDEELSEVERQVNEKILAGMNVNISEMPVDEARKLGAMALFGEKYGETVRVVRMGDFSIELCGGTHLDNTAKAGLFKIISEASIAAGVRRIEAVCGFEILNKIERDIKLIMEAAEAVKTSPKDLLPKINSALSEIKALKQENAKLKEHEAKSRAAGLLGSAADIGGIKVVTSGYRDTEPDTLRAMGEELCRIEQNAVVVFSAENDGKLVFTANCGKNAISRGIKAGDLVREVSKIAGGGGGGRPDSAMAGGKDISKAGAALGFVYEYVKNITG